MSDNGPLVGRGRKSSNTHLAQESGSLEQEDVYLGRLDHALLVHIQIDSERSKNNPQELTLLSQTAGLHVDELITGKRPKPDPATFIGSGKIEEIRQKLRHHEAGLVVFDHEITPIQERNLAHALKARVIDRTGLILDIFAQRARSHEGQLQVELAQLERLSTRLVRGWTHLERQKGGIGLRGPGETQLETDRRLLSKRVKLLKDRLDKVRKSHRVQRQSRSRAGLLRVSFVGYTNAGKSTLFNRLTHAKAYVADQLFATLDTTTRRVYIDGIGQMVLSDTVGFIQHLPHTLVAAFKATLDETIESDLLLHVVDAADKNRDLHQESVNQVLKDIGADHIPQVLVLNKIDQLVDWQAGLIRDPYGTIEEVHLSAMNGQGMEFIRQAFVERINDLMQKEDTSITLDKDLILNYGNQDTKLDRTA
ncbi:MAG: GTPase HflX [Ferrovum sp. 37-45-19]|jgi:GTP-binding protein HflX|uniref:GTPase HflX n=1 Tax=Ferrovum sp. JA12 TaxID=1356299 RepID=UPI0007127F03|nr:GTPase HflX [Ferrovum sp. JA12]OYV80167.1 MAG: GTPase HflX [Ferrovum sp. 21-44-67]OYV94444.1 MAG: GTPase HflX [Ferrovum sp. 37-45-19]OZB32428.1 MAG: GTPase HflX [Ferrovum sp. 34-44-207]HQT81659.1 GTPase HflX [Ferrovaceae bacterium]KRH78846.1 GTPase HflX [Ferrovum sp. JA12]